MVDFFINMDKPWSNENGLFRDTALVVPVFVDGLLYKVPCGAGSAVWAPHYLCVVWMPLRLAVGRGRRSSSWASRQKWSEGMCG